VAFALKHTPLFSFFVNFEKKWICRGLLPEPEVKGEVVVVHVNYCQVVVVEHVSSEKLLLTSHLIGYVLMM
jgi:hypothetical protein